MTSWNLYPEPLRGFIIYFDLIGWLRSLSNQIKVFCGAKRGSGPPASSMINLPSCSRNKFHDVIVANSLATCLYCSGGSLLKQVWCMFRAVVVQLLWQSSLFIKKSPGFFFSFHVFCSYEYISLILIHPISHFLFYEFHPMLTQCIFGTTFYNDPFIIP